jgi:hypothetical protein
LYRDLSRDFDQTKNCFYFEKKEKEKGKNDEKENV